MPAELLMPRVAPAMQDGMIVKWFKQEGDSVKKGEIVVEITSEKASCEVESLTDGTLYKILAQPGDVIPVNKPVAIIRLPNDTQQDLGAVQTTKSNPVIFVDGQHVEINAPVPASQSAPTGRIKASPLARRIAANEGIELALIKSGSGPEGRIVKKDVLNFLAAASSKKVVSVLQSQPDKRIPVSLIRRETAKRLQLSKDNTIPVTSVTEVDLTDFLTLYQSAKLAWKEVHDVSITLNAFFVKATALSLRRHEMLNSTFEGNEIVIRGDINIGLAMNHNDQLFVPVIRHADTLSIVQIGETIAHFVEKMKDNRLTLEDMSAGTFTITNVGPFDVQFSTPVIAYPQVGILGIGKVNERPAFEGDAIVRKQFCYLSLTYDHKAIDGVPAAGFRKTLKQLLEKPLSLLS